MPPSPLVDFAAQQRTWAKKMRNVYYVKVQEDEFYGYWFDCLLTGEAAAAYDPLARSVELPTGAAT